MIEHDAMSILHNVVCQTIYGDELQPHSAKISCGKKRSVKPNSITLSDDDLVVCAGTKYSLFAYYNTFILTVVQYITVLLCIYFLR